MKKLQIGLLMTSLIAANAATAHPTNVPFETRGECEAAYAESSKLDRERLVDQLGIFETYGAAQRTFNETFQCQYDEEEQTWFIVFIGGA
ncbi:MAG TPA: hypothetical protein VF135_11905 [Terriglobales bacterium]